MGADDKVWVISPKHGELWAAGKLLAKYGFVYREELYRVEVMPVGYSGGLCTHAKSARDAVQVIRDFTNRTWVGLNPEEVLRG